MPDYLRGQAVENNGSTYVCIADHTSGSSTEPGVGASWATVWSLLAASGLASGVSDGDKGDITVSSSGSTWTIDNQAVTNTKLANVSTSTIKGRITAGSGSPEDLTASQARTLLNVADGANNYSHPNHSGDVTSSGDGATTIASGAVTYAKIQNVSATDRLLGRSSAGAGVIQEITCSSFGRNLIDDADAGAGRTTLGLGGAATLNVGTTAGTVAAGDHTHAQLHDAATVVDTDTLDLTLTGQQIGGVVRLQQSLTSDASGVKLVGDSASPGNSKLYGTDGSGVRGWYDQPAGGGLSDGVKGGIKVSGSGTIFTLYPLHVPLVTDIAWTWTNMPAALTFIGGNIRMVQRLDLSNYTEVRFMVFKAGGAGAASSKLILRYRTTISTTAANWLDIGTSEVSVAINVMNTFLETAWINLVAEAQADVFVSVMGEGGDGVLDPVFGSVVAQFR